MNSLHITALLTIPVRRQSSKKKQKSEINEKNNTASFDSNR